MKSDLVDFKDNVGRNKLMVLVGELERGVEFKKSIIRGCVDCLLDKLSGDEYSNLSDLALWPSYKSLAITHISTMHLNRDCPQFSKV